MRYFLTILGMLLGLIIGAAAVVFGEFDDSPGLQGLGLILAITALFFGVRSLRRQRKSHTRQTV